MDPALRHLELWHAFEQVWPEAASFLVSALLSLKRLLVKCSSCGQLHHRNAQAAKNQLRENWLVVQQQPESQPGCQRSSAAVAGGSLHTAQGSGPVALIATYHSLAGPVARCCR